MNKMEERKSTWIDSDCTNDSIKYENEAAIDNNSNDVKSYENMFPWLVKFNTLMCSSMGNKNYQILQHLISVYKQYILGSINKCYVNRPIMMILKNHISDTLMFFHLYWNNIKEHVIDCTSYLNEISQLLEIYIDVELKTIKDSVHSAEVASKILVALWIYLCNSERHIFRILLKLKLFSKKYLKVYDFIFMKIFNCLKQQVEFLTDIDYVRYILILKLWKKLKENNVEEKEVNDVAVRVLGPHIPKIRDELLKIIPALAMGQERETVWLLQPNAFDLKTACYNFILFEDTIFTKFTNSMSDTNLHSQLPQSLVCKNKKWPTNCDTKKSQRSSLKNRDDLINKMKYSNMKCHIFTTKKRNKLKRCQSSSKLKPGEVVLIDLTEENETIVDKREYRRKTKGKLEWLKLVKKNYQVQGKSNEIKSINNLENRNFDNIGNCGRFLQSDYLGHLPLTGSKINKNTGICTFIEWGTTEKNIHNLQSQHDHMFTKQYNDLECILQDKPCDSCTTSPQQVNLQQDRIAHLLKLLNIVGKDINHPQIILNLLGENSNENITAYPHFSIYKTNESSDLNVHDKQKFFSDSKNSVQTAFISNEHQNNVSNTKLVKREMQTTNSCGNVLDSNSACYYHECRPLENNSELYDLKHKNNSTLQTAELNQEAFLDTHECTKCNKKGVGLFSCQDDAMFTLLKNKDKATHAVNNNVTNKKSVSDKNVICILSDLDKCMDILKHISEHIMTVHTEKQPSRYLDKIDTSSVFSSYSKCQCMKWPCDWIKNINSLTDLKKLSKFIEIYEGKQRLNTCTCRDACIQSSQESDTLLNKVKYEKNSCQRISESSQVKEYCSHERNIISSNKKLPYIFTCNQVKLECEYSIKREDTDSPNVLKDEMLESSKNKNIIDNQIFNTEFPMNVQKHIEESKQKTLSSSQGTNVTKSHTLDEFENIDIFDSILNGDITFEGESEIWEDSQSPKVSPINHDNSHNVLNCVTELFSESDRVFGNERDEKYVASVSENFQTPPEESFDTTGSLNFLFDFDLSSTNFSTNDSVYSKIPAVNPLLIKKNLTDENHLAANYNSTGLFSEQNIYASEKSYIETMPLHKERELYSDQSTAISDSVNVVGFGLNSSRNRASELTRLTKRVSSFSSHSKYSIISHNDKFDTDSISEKSNIFPQKDINNEVQALSDVTSRDLYEVCISDSVEPDTSPAMVKLPSDSYDLMSLSDIMAYNMDTSIQWTEQKYEHFIRPTNNEGKIQHDCVEIHGNAVKQSVQSNSKCHSPKLKRKKSTKVKEKKRKKLPSPIVPPKQKELSLKCSQVTVINPLNCNDLQSTCELPLSSFHMSYYKKTPQAVRSSAKLSKHLQCAGIQQLKNISQQKQQILLNIQEDSVIKKIFSKDLKFEYPNIISEDINVLDNSSLFEFSNRNMNVNIDISKLKLTTDKDIAEVPNSIFIKSDTKCSLQNDSAEPTKFRKKNLLSTPVEDTPLKKRKLMKYSPSLKTNAVVCTINQQKIQKQKLAPTKKGITCTNKHKDTINE